MRFSLGATVSQVATVIGVAARGISYLKDNLKIYFDFKSDRAKTLEFVGTGSHYFTSNDYITTTYSLGTASGFTFAFWMQDSALTQGDNYMDNRDSASDGVTFFGSSTNEMTLRINGNDVESSNDLTTGWNHIVGTYDGAIKTIYVNGVATSNAETSSINVAGNLRIGARSYSISNYVTGYMKNCAVWERALSASEVQNIMYKTYSDLKGTETTHLKAWWSMDSQVGSDGNAGSGYVLDEVSGAGSTTNLGTVSGATLKSGIYAGYSPRKPRGFDNAPTAQADLIGSGSASFTASSDDYINIGDAPTLTTAGTVMAWVKPTSAALGGAEFSVISKYDYGSSTNKREWALITTNDGGTNGCPSFLAMDDGDTYTANTRATSGTALTANKWQHLAGTFSTSDDHKVKLYVDGVLMNTSSHSLVDGIENSDIDTRIGIASNNGSLVWEWDGNIAQVGIFNSVLSQEQIQSISQKTYSELSTNEKTNVDGSGGALVSWWGLDSTIESSGTGASFVYDLNNTTLESNIATSFPSLSVITYDSGTGKYNYDDSVTGIMSTGTITAFSGIFKIQITVYDDSVTNGKAHLGLFYRKVSDNGLITIKAAHTIDTSSSGITYTYYGNATESCDEFLIYGYTNKDDFFIDSITVQKVNGNPGELK